MDLGGDHGGVLRRPRIPRRSPKDSRNKRAGRPRGGALSSQRSHKVKVLWPREKTCGLADWTERPAGKDRTPPPVPNRQERARFFTSVLNLRRVHGDGQCLPALPGANEERMGVGAGLRAPRS